MPKMSQVIGYNYGRSPRNTQYVANSDILSKATWGDNQIFFTWLFVENKDTSFGVAFFPPTNHISQAPNWHVAWLALMLNTKNFSFSIKQTPSFRPTNSLLDYMYGNPRKPQYPPTSAPPPMPSARVKIEGSDNSSLVGNRQSRSSQDPESLTTKQTPSKA